MTPHEVIVATVSGCTLAGCYLGWLLGRSCPPKRQLAAVEYEAYEEGFQEGLRSAGEVMPLEAVSAAADTTRRLVDVPRPEPFTHNDNGLGHPGAGAAPGAEAGGSEPFGVTARQHSDEQFWDDAVPNTALLHDVPRPDPDPPLGAGPGHITHLAVIARELGHTVIDGVVEPDEGPMSEWFTQGEARHRAEMASIGESGWFARVAAQ